MILPKAPETYNAGDEQRTRHAISQTILGITSLFRKGGKPVALTLLGTTTSDDAEVGNVGEYIKSGVLRGAGALYTSGAALNITSIDLTAGDWDITGIAAISPGSGTITQFYGGVGAASHYLPPYGADGLVSLLQGLNATGDLSVSVAGRLSLAAPATAYLVGVPIFSATASGWGFIGARRAR